MFCICTVCIYYRYRKKGIHCYYNGILFYDLPNAEAINATLHENYNKGSWLCSFAEVRNTMNITSTT